MKHQLRLKRAEAVQKETRFLDPKFLQAKSRWEDWLSELGRLTTYHGRRTIQGQTRSQEGRVGSQGEFLTHLESYLRTASTCPGISESLCLVAPMSLRDEWDRVWGLYGSCHTTIHWVVCFVELRVLQAERHWVQITAPVRWEGNGSNVFSMWEGWCFS